MDTTKIGTKVRIVEKHLPRYGEMGTIVQINMLGDISVQFDDGVTYMYQSGYRDILEDLFTKPAHPTAVLADEIKVNYQNLKQERFEALKQEVDRLPYEHLHELWIYINQLMQEAENENNANIPNQIAHDSGIQESVTSQVGESDGTTTTDNQ